MIVVEFECAECGATVSEKSDGVSVVITLLSGEPESGYYLCGVCRQALIDHWENRSLHAKSKTYFYPRRATVPREIGFDVPQIDQDRLHREPVLFCEGAGWA